MNSITNNVFEKVEIIILTSSLDNMESTKLIDYSIIACIEKPLTSGKLQKVLGSKIQAE